MRTIFTLLVGVVAMVCTGCEVDDTELKNSKTYTLYEDISALVISDGVDVIVDDALPHDQVYALTNANNFNRLRVRVTDGTLHIGVSSSLFGFKRCLVYVPSLAYKSVAAEGGSEFSWNSCNSYRLSVMASGGSDCQIKGVTQQLCIDVSGGSDIECGWLEAEDVTIDASGGSDVDAVANSTLSLTASGGSDIHIKGNPQIIHWDVSGGSDVEFN
ncbi:MAG: DUF2807 domain-containing protein [Alistipes sp.]|nr:DUF2807 domain-containing protein [Alistipes sp.]